jgi:hypothetical protein
MYLVWLPEGTTPEAVRTTMVDQVGFRLLDLEPVGLSMVLDDDLAQFPPPLPPTEGEPQVRAIVSVWLQRCDDRDPYEAILGDVATQVHGYSVTESLYTEYGESRWSGPRTWPDGERSPAVLTCSWFPPKRDVPYLEWIDFWHTRISPMSAEVQPRMRYVRNAVARPLQAGIPELGAIVEEAWPSGEHIVDPMLFYNADGDPKKMAANQQRMIDDVVQFIDLEVMRNNTMSEWILKSLPT